MRSPLPHDRIWHEILPIDFIAIAATILESVGIDECADGSLDSIGPFNYNSHN